jgi:ferredoxin
MIGHRIARSHQTDFIYLDTGKCRACWKCTESCPSGVIGKVNLPFHKHARIDRPGECTGCRKCLNICPEKAIGSRLAGNDIQSLSLMTIRVARQTA